MGRSSVNRPFRRRRISPLPQPVLHRHKPLPASPDPVLPFDLVWEILARLPVRSLMRFKCVSRTWRSIILDPSFARAYRGGFRGLLIAEPALLRLTPKKYFFYVNLDGDGPATEICHHHTVDHDGRRMGYSNIVDGLVCFYHGNYSCLYNIATRETQQLPLSTHDEVACSYHFGFDAVNNLYKLLKISPIYEHYDDRYLFPLEGADFVRYLNCEILTLGVDSSWRIIDSLPPVEIRRIRSQCFGGVLYWMEWREDTVGSLIAFHLTEEKFYSIPTPTKEGIPLNVHLSNFGPGLALIRSPIVLGCCRASIFHYQSGNHHWAEQKIEFRVPKEYELTPQGILPNGKVLISNTDVCNTNSSPFYLYDLINREFEKKVMHIPSPICSLLREADNFQPIDDNSSYHEENVVPLSCLNSSFTIQGGV